MKQCGLGKRGGGKMGEGNYWRQLALVVIVGLLIRIALLHVHPFYLDECLYVEMMEEQIQKPSLVSTFLGYPTTWKPPLFFLLYSIPVAALKMLTTDIELAYRLPNILLGSIVNTALVFLILRRMDEERTAFYAAAFYVLCPLTVYTDLRVLIDPLNTAFILSSIYFYLDGQKKGSTLLMAIFAFLASFTKSLVAFIIPLVIVCDIIAKKGGYNRALISVLAVALGMALHYAILFHFVPELAVEELKFDFLGRFGEGNGILPYAGNGLGSALVFLHMLLVFSALGFLIFWNKNGAASGWFLGLVFPIFASQGMVWYFYPLVPILAYFAVKALSYDYATKKERYDALFKIAVAILIALNFAIVGLWYGYWYKGFLMDEREIGNSLVGKDDVMFIGDYQPTLTSLTYKILGERVKEGKYRDFGWIILTRNDSLQKQIAQVSEFAKTYGTDRYPAEEGGFSTLFWAIGIFRKPTNISVFDYIAVSLVGINSTNQSSWKQGIYVEGYQTLDEGKTTLLLRRMQN